MEDRLFQLVLEAKRLLASGQPFPEIEIRLGKQDIETEKFTAGLSQNAAASLCTAFINADFWEETCEWERSHVFLYTLPHSGRQVRTETIFQSSGIRTFTQEKKKILNIDFLLSDTLPQPVARKETSVTKTSVSLPCARVALAIENPILTCDLPQTVQPEKVFVKHRRTFVLASSGFGKVWEYTITRRWGGDTARLDDIYKPQLDDASAITEMEIECVNQKYFEAHSTMYIVQSILAKVRHVLQLLGVD